ncbi:MAG: FAD-binding oxidoreductase [Sarcina sp.]
MNDLNSGEWQGFKDFTVYKKVFETKNIISIYLKPIDGSKVYKHKAGQFIGIKMKTENKEIASLVRLYSISSIPNNEFYILTIKVVEDGRMTNYIKDYLHEGDEILVTMPKGKFALEKEHLDEKIVLLGAGIGVTPVYSMLQDIQGSVNIHFVYSLRNRENDCFIDEIKAYDKLPKTKVDIFFTRPLERERKMRDFDYEGRITKEWIVEHLPLDASFYFCGSKNFAQMIETTLLELGVAKEKIHCEYF